MADIKIKITTQADLKALEQTRASSKGLEQELHGVTKETKDAKAPLEELAKSSEKAGVSKKTLKEAIKALSHAIPGLHDALLILKNPFVIAAGAIAAAIAAVTSYIQKLDELAEAAKAHENVGRSFGAMGGFLRDAKENLAAFNKALDESATKAGDLKEKLDGVTDAIKNANRLEDEKRDAKEALALEEVNADEKTKKITPLEAFKKRAEVRARFAKQREDAVNAQQREIIEAKEGALRSTMELRVGAEQKLPGAEAEAARLERLAKIDPKIAESDLKTATDSITELEGKKKKLEDSLYWSRYHAKPDPITGVPDPQALRRVAGEEADLKDIESELEHARRQKDFAESRADKGVAKKKAEEARKAVESIQSVIMTSREREGVLFEDIVSSKNGIDSSGRVRSEINALKEKRISVSERADVEVQELRSVVEAQREFIKEMRNTMKELKTEFKRGQKIAKDIEARRAE